MGYGAHLLRDARRWAITALDPHNPGAPLSENLHMNSALLMFTGDINLMNVTDPALPFARISDTLHTADVLFGNLECCLYQPADAGSVMDEGFYAAPAAGQALKHAGYSVLGNANNVNYGAAAIRSSLHELDLLGIPLHRRGSGSCAGARAGNHRARRRALRISATHLRILADKSRSR